MSLWTIFDTCAGREILTNLSVVMFFAHILKFAKAKFVIHASFSFHFNNFVTLGLVVILPYQRHICKLFLIWFFGVDVGLASWSLEPMTFLGAGLCLHCACYQNHPETQFRSFYCALLTKPMDFAGQFEVNFLCCPYFLISLNSTQYYTSLLRIVLYCIVQCPMSNVM